MSRLEAARKHIGLSREKAAARIDVSSKTIERWEKGVTPAPRYQLIKLAEVYMTTIDELASDEVAA